MRKVMLLIGVLFGVALVPKDANAVYCWYCVGWTEEYPYGQCTRLLYTGNYGYTSCQQIGNTCYMSGLCPYTILGPAGIDAVGIVAGGCGILGGDPAQLPSDEALAEVTI